MTQTNMYSSKKLSTLAVLLTGSILTLGGIILVLPRQAEAALNPGQAVSQVLEQKSPLESAAVAPIAPVSSETQSSTTAATIQARPVNPASTQSARIVAPSSIVDTNINTDPATSGTTRTNIPPKPAPKQKWVVVDISEQRIYFYEDGRVVRSNLVSTGLPGTPTNIGTHYVWSRVYNETMSGPGYYLENVYFTQYFNSEGEALHYAWWHNNFGRPMSHGCVNMNWDTSKFAWYWAPPRMKVVVKN